MLDKSNHRVQFLIPKDVVCGSGGGGVKGTFFMVQIVSHTNRNQNVSDASLNHAQLAESATLVTLIGCGGVSGASEITPSRLLATLHVSLIISLTHSRFCHAPHMCRCPSGPAFAIETDSAFFPLGCAFLRGCEAAPVGRRWSVSQAG